MKISGIRILSVTLLGLVSASSFAQIQPVPTPPHYPPTPYPTPYPPTPYPTPYPPQPYPPTPYPPRPPGGDMQTFHNPTANRGGLRVMFTAQGRNNGDYICNFLGYRYAVDIGGWQHGRTSTEYDRTVGYTLYPNSPSSAQSISVNQTDMVWTRVTCGGHGGGYPPSPTDPWQVVLNTPTIHNGEYYRFLAYGRDNADAICNQLGYRGAVDPQAWQYSMVEDYYRYQVRYLIEAFDYNNFRYVSVSNHPYYWSRIICQR